MNELSLREDFTYEVKEYGYRPTACTEFALANSPFIAILRKQKQMSETLFLPPGNYQDDLESPV